MIWWCGAYLDMIIGMSVSSFVRCVVKFFAYLLIELFVLLLSCKIYLYNLEVSPMSEYLMIIFLPVHTLCLHFLQEVVSAEVFGWWVPIYYFFGRVCAKKSFTSQGHKDFNLVFSFKNLKVLAFMFRSKIHFRLIFVYDAK